MLFRYALLSFLLISCGSRKVEIKKDVQQTEVKTEVQTNVQEQIKIIDSSFIDEFEICPIIDTLPIVVNGVTYKNARLTYKKTKVNKIYTNDKKIQQNERKQAVVKRKTFQKETERILPYWYWIIFILLIFVFYYLSKKADI
jgi:hypothetical protein